MAIYARKLVPSKECEKWHDREKAFSLATAYNTRAAAHAAGHLCYDSHANGPLKQHPTSNGAALPTTLWST